MKRSSGQILTSHTGSVYLPPRDDHGAPAAPRDDAELARAVRSVVDKQLNVGLDVINDGDLCMGLKLLQCMPEVFGGVEQRAREAGRGSPRGRPNADMETFAEYYSGHPMMPFDVGLFACTGPLAARDLARLKWSVETLKGATAGRSVGDLFMCFLSPGWLYEWIWDEHYGSYEKFVLALGEAVRPYYKAIVEAGLILQIDAPDIVDNWTWDRWHDLKAYRKHLEIRLQALSNALGGLPEERVRLHLCWGSWRGPHGSELPLEDVLDLIYTVPAQCYSIEAAKPNHTHEWRAFQKHRLPDGKILMPGVIDHTTPVLEHPQVIADRLVDYANVVGRENVIAGTDCGMRIDSRVEWAKLERMVQGAKLASEALFS